MAKTNLRTGSRVHIPGIGEMRIVKVGTQYAVMSELHFQNFKDGKPWWAWKYYSRSEIAMLSQTH